MEEKERKKTRRREKERSIFNLFSTRSLSFSRLRDQTSKQASKRAIEGARLRFEKGRGGAEKKSKKKTKKIKKKTGKKRKKRPEPFQLLLILRTLLAVLFPSPAFMETPTTQVIVFLVDD